MKHLLMTIMLLAVQYTTFAHANQAGSDPYIGRIILDGRDVCNGSLVAPSIVITSGHCLQQAGQTAATPLGRIKFLIKSPEDKKRRLFSVINVGMPPDFKYKSPLNPEVLTLQNDVALIRLDGIATRSSFEVIGDPPGPDTIAYLPLKIGGDRAPYGSENCLNKVLESDLILLSCSRDEGFSGSPVFYNKNGKRYLGGVVTAKSTRSGTAVLYATIPVVGLPEVIWRKNPEAHQTKKLLSGKTRP